MINIVAINGKNFEHLYDKVARKQNFPDQQKRKVDNSKMWRNEKGQQISSKSFVEIQKAKEHMGTPSTNVGFFWAL